MLDNNIKNSEISDNDLLLKISKKIVKKVYIEDNKLTDYASGDLIYPFTNENLFEYYNKNLENKRVISVTSSGDHILNALIYGAKDIDAFDINPLAKYFSELKIAAIKALSYDEFLMFFYSKNIFTNIFFLNKKIYNKVKEYLTQNNRLFWDYIFTNYNINKVKNSFLFSDDYLKINNLIKANKYLEKENFLKLKYILLDKKITYYDINLNNLHLLHKKYDIIILSNILASIDDINKLKKYRDILKTISSDNNIVILCYLYSDILANEKKEGVYSSDLINELFPELEYLTFED